MTPILTTLAIVLALGSWPLTQIAAEEAPQATVQAAPSPGQVPSVQQLPAPAPATPIGTASNAVQITNGPVVENVTDTTAQIAWSTNVNSGTALRYGTDPSHLDLTVGMPWGGLTHRVNIKDLQTHTT